MDDDATLSPASDLADAVIPPPLEALGTAAAALPALAEAGGEAFNALLERRRSALGAEPLPLPLTSVSLRTEALLALLAELLARPFALRSQSGGVPLSLSLEVGLFLCHLGHALCEFGLRDPLLLA